MSRFARVLYVSLIVALTLNAVAQAAPKTDCATIEDSAQRLECYDATARSKKPVDETESIFTRHWKDDAKRKSFELTSHRPSYLLPIAYNRRPNVDVYRAEDPDTDLDHNEIKFQISLKLKIDDNLFGDNGDLWFGFTQRSWWQAYAKDSSSPFRETNYEPELFLSFLTDYEFLGLSGRVFNIGVVHESNGRSEPLSRSWNRVYAQIGFERDQFALVLKPWLRIPENRNEDDNRDITDFMGHGEVWAYYHHKNHFFGLMVRNVEDLRHGGVELDWTFPIFRRLRGLVHIYHGYGESLIDYNHSNQRIGFGLLITDWL